MRIWKWPGYRQGSAIRMPFLFLFPYTWAQLITLFGAKFGGALYAGGRESSLKSLSEETLCRESNSNSRSFPLKGLTIEYAK